MYLVGVIASLVEGYAASWQSFFVGCFLQILIAMCPLAVIVFSVSMTPDYTVKERLHTIKIACWVAWSVLITTAIAGPKALAAVGIALEAFKIAGGILLVIVGFGMLRSPDPEISTSKEITEINPSSAKKHQDIAIAPLGIPLIAGPGTLAVVLSKRAAGQGIADFGACLLAISVIILLVYMMLALAAKSAKWLTPTVLKLSFRLSGLFLVAMGVQLTMNGLKETELITNSDTPYVIT